MPLNIIIIGSRRPIFWGQEYFHQKVPGVAKYDMDANLFTPNASEASYKPKQCSYRKTGGEGNR